MGTLYFDRALTPDGWHADVAITTDAGRIVEVTPEAPASAAAERHPIGLPGMPDLHSHAFQRGMAGLAEFRGGSQDTFWTWREVMYRFALTVSPDDVEAIAAQLYLEMLEAGFTRVGEFHYLHHDRDGRPYGDVAEMAARIAAAASEAGIGLTLLPVFYAHANFGGWAPKPEQRRFVTDLDGYSRLLDASRSAVRDLPSAIVGVAPHSLRAATPEEVSAVAAMTGDGPIHIHAAEQVREVEECLAWSGARPVDWLLDHAAVDENWCLIHATHMTDTETAALARSGAVAGLCPITEANLGDGIFNAVPFLREGGRFGIGSDSNIRIGVADELRQLEYAQRLKHRARNIMAGSSRSTGRSLFDAALDGGSAALGGKSCGLTVGAPADIVSLDADHRSLIGRTGDALLDSWLFSGGDCVVDCVWTGGVKRVSGGRHHSRESIRSRFRAAIERLTV